MFPLFQCFRKMAFALMYLQSQIQQNIIRELLNVVVVGNMRLTASRLTSCACCVCFWYVLLFISWRHFCRARSRLLVDIVTTSASDTMSHNKAVN